MKEIYRRNKIIRKLLKKRHFKQKPVIKIIPAMDRVLDGSFDLKISNISCSMIFNSENEYKLYCEIVDMANKDIRKANMKINDLYYETEKLYAKINNYKESMIKKDRFILKLWKQRKNNNKDKV